MSERWVPVCGYEGSYEISSCGAVRSMARWIDGPKGPALLRPVRLKPFQFSNGYLRVSLSKGSTKCNFSVHRLVLEAFIGPAGPGMCCRHLNGNRKDNRVENLAWGTPKENAEDRMGHGTQQFGEHHFAAKLTDDIVRELRAGRLRVSECARKFGVSQNAASCAKNKKTWKHVQEEL